MELCVNQLNAEQEYVKRKAAEIKVEKHLGAHVLDFIDIKAIDMHTKF